jgi:glycosyltransferase involved in cell wall biosynthesis
MSIISNTDLKPELVLSIIIPVYKDLHGLTDTIDSLNKQTADSRLYEIIVANDGGDEAISAYCEKQNIICVNIVPNKGSYNARNEAIKKSNSAAIYMAFIDADIIADKDWIKNGIKHLQQYDYVGGDVKVPKELVKDIATFHDYLTAFPMKSYFVDYGFGGAGNLFIKKEVIKKIGPFNALLRSGGDLEFGRRAGEDKTIKKAFAEDCLLFHAPRTHQEKVMKMKRVKQGHKNLLEINSEGFEFLNNKSNLFKLLLPPSWSSVEKIYHFDERFNKWQLFLYMYRLKLLRFSINLSS